MSEFSDMRHLRRSMDGRPDRSSGRAGSQPGPPSALSAATHVPAQVFFGVVFAGVPMCRGLVAGAAAAGATWRGVPVARRPALAR
jgi:hypothetical protein